MSLASQPQLPPLEFATINRDGLRMDTENWTHLIDADHPQRVVTHRSHDARHKGPMPVLILDVPILPAIHKVRSIDVVYDPCSRNALCIMGTHQKGLLTRHCSPATPIGQQPLRQPSIMSLTLAKP